MDIAFVSGNPHIPQVYGGVEINTHALACELMHRGNSVCVLAKLSLRNGFGLWRAARLALPGGALRPDKDLGYPVFRSRRLVRDASALPRPAVAVVQNGPMIELAGGFERLGVPTVAYLHGLGFETWCGSPESFPFRGYIANSQYTAARLRRRFGFDPVVLPPLFRREDYATARTGAMVTFINPVAVKGVDLAFDIAALCPEIPFMFVRAWPLHARAEARLRQRARRLGNVTLRDRTADMRSVYADTRILLAPSQWEDETWGRVVSEAQFSGIPAVASDRGGLPESVGPGGIILPHDAPAAAWAEAIAALWADGAAYEALAQAARQHAERAELAPERQCEALLDALRNFAG